MNKNSIEENNEFSEHLEINDDQNEQETGNIEVAETEYQEVGEVLIYVDDVYAVIGEYDDQSDAFEDSDSDDSLVNKEQENEEAAFLNSGLKENKLNRDEEEEKDEDEDEDLGNEIESEEEKKYYENAERETENGEEDAAEIDEVQLNVNTVYANSKCPGLKMEPCDDKNFLKMDRRSGFTWSEALNHYGALKSKKGIQHRQATTARKYFDAAQNHFQRYQQTRQPLVGSQRGYD